MERPQAAGRCSGTAPRTNDIDTAERRQKILQPGRPTIPARRGGLREESGSRGWEGGWTASTKRRTIDGGETPLPTQRMSTKT